MEGCESVIYASNFIKRLENVDAVFSNLMYLLEEERSIDKLRAVKVYLGGLDPEILQEYVIYTGLDPYAQFWYEGKETLIHCMIVSYAQSMIIYERGLFLQFIFDFYDMA